MRQIDCFLQGHKVPQPYYRSYKSARRRSVVKEIKGYAHVAIKVSDLDRTLGFYVESLASPR